VAAGAPEDIASDPASYTGEYLAPLLNHKKRKASAR
jgi:excinuclease UvrABC ATPase subunit